MNYTSISLCFQQNSGDVGMAGLVDHATMREMNLSLIMRTLYRKAPISRAQLSNLTGLHKASISGMVRDLLTNGMIQELPQTTDTGEVGRPAILLQVNPDAGAILSLEIGVGFVLLVATDFSMEVVLRDYRDAVDFDDPEGTLSLAVTMLQRAIDHFQRRNQRVFGIAVGVAGLVNSHHGALLFAPNLNWHNVPIREFLCSHFDLPITVANEANLAAVGESYQYEEGAGFLLYVSSGIGLGGGIVLNGELLEGTSGHAGEIGHMTVDPDGRLCHCGNHGCWETVASQQALFRAVRERIASGESSQLSPDRLDQLTVSQVVMAATEGDLVCQEALQQVGQWLGIGIANLVNVINPHRAVLGGPLAEAHDYLLPVIRRTVQKRAFPWLRDTVNIEISAYLTDAAAIGGAVMIHKQILDHPAEWLNHHDNT